MNSLNILAARVNGPTPPQTPTSNRTRSYSDGIPKKETTNNKPKRSASQHVKGGTSNVVLEKERSFGSNKLEDDMNVAAGSGQLNEKTPLLGGDENLDPPINANSRYKKIRLAAKRLVAALTKSLRWVLSALASPGVYVVAGLYDEKGTFSPLLPMRKLGRVLPRRNGRTSTAQAVGLSGSSDHSEQAATSKTDVKNVRRKAQSKDLRRKLRGADSAAATSESEADVGEHAVMLTTPTESRPRLQTSSSSEDLPHARRSIRIKLYNEDTARRRKLRKEKSESSQVADSFREPSLTVANIKSPTSPASTLKMTRYPRAPAPPRPLIPRRQPSYSAPTSSRSSRLTKKTLVIDLDETLIHSLAKGGRMSSGHMVEVKLNNTVGYGGATLGPQHPILYYVHKRPHCDDFLRKVCKWYNLVVFTASVQEYADPVIDWLEQERKYFSGRYYRQHCTFRNGAYIKDLSSVEPDLSKVMILDNSPLSYIFHEDNAIPIEGWINDPTDNDLLHLVPILEALQYVTDVRALLALRRGQTEWSITGRWTGSTDLPLTPAGEAQVSRSARALVGPTLLIDPRKLVRVFISPMQRAHMTYELMFEPQIRQTLLEGKVEFSTDLIEWQYGDYEGMKTKEIRQLREQRGLNGASWDHFKDGAEGGESPEQITERVDRVIKQIREIQRPNMHGEKACDVLLIAHGHILRAFTRRWLGYPMSFPLSMMLEPGGIGILSYQHHNIDEPAFLLGLALP